VHCLAVVVLEDVDGVEEVPVQAGAHEQTVIHGLVGAAANPRQVYGQLRLEKTGVELFPGHSVVTEYDVSGLESEHVVGQGPVDQQGVVGQGGQAGAEAGVVDPAAGHQQRHPGLRSRSPGHLLVDEVGVGVHEGQGEVIQDRGEAPPAHPVGDLGPVAVPDGVHIHLEVDERAELRVDRPPQGIEDHEVIPGRLAGSPGGVDQRLPILLGGAAEGEMVFRHEGRLELEPLMQLEVRPVGLVQGLCRGGGAETETRDERDRGD